MRLRRLMAALVCVVPLIMSGLATGADLKKRTMCIWDPVGNNGPVVTFFGDLPAEAIGWGLDFKFVPYDDENLAAQDLRDGKCDISVVTAILSRELVQFAGTLDAIGGLTSEYKLRKTMATITSPKATPLMSEGDYEVTAILPVGSMFAYVKNRRLDSIDDFRGKKLAVLNNDIQARTFAQLAEAVPVDETLSTFAKSFNQGRVDIVLMPALAYETFELYHGLGEQGGILDVRMFYGMLQAVARKSRFEEDFGHKMRQYMLNRLKRALDLINNAEETIPPHYWIKTDERTRERLESFYKDIRLQLKVSDLFDAKALSLLWKIRCSVSPDEQECRVP